MGSSYRQLDLGQHASHWSLKGPGKKMERKKKQVIFGRGKVACVASVSVGFGNKETLATQTRGKVPVKEEEAAWPSC